MNNTELEKVYRLYYNSLYIYALSLCKSEAKAKDLVQETFLKALLSLNSADGNVKYWLVKVCRNIYFNEVKYQKRFIYVEEDIINTIKSDEDVFKNVIKKDQKRELMNNILKLPSIQKDVLLYWVYFELSDNEISKIMNISNQNIRQIKSRAKKNLMQIMEVDYE